MDLQLKEDWLSAEDTSNPPFGNRSGQLGNGNGSDEANLEAGSGTDKERFIAGNGSFGKGRPPSFHIVPSKYFPRPNVSNQYLSRFIYFRLFTNET